MSDELPEQDPQQEEPQTEQSLLTDETNPAQAHEKIRAKQERNGEGTPPLGAAQ